MTTEKRQLRINAVVELTAAEKLPEGAVVNLQFPIDQMDIILEGTDTTPDLTPETPTQPDPEETVQGPENDGVPEQPTEPTESPKPSPLKVLNSPSEMIWDPFVKEKRHFNRIGTASDLGLTESGWTIRIEARFSDIGSAHTRVIASETSNGIGTSLQLGVLKDGYAWLDVLGGAVTTSPFQLENNKEYEIFYSHDSEGRVRIHVDRQLMGRGRVPIFRGTGEMTIGKWLNYYHSFELKTAELYPLLTEEEIQSI